MVSGDARVKSKRDKGRIGYECEVRMPHVEVSSAKYWWEDKSSKGKTKPVSVDSVKTCHQAMRAKMNLLGYSKVEFEITHSQKVDQNTNKVWGRMLMHQDSSKQGARYECRINTETGKVKKSKFWPG